MGGRVVEICAQESQPLLLQASLLVGSQCGRYLRFMLGDAGGIAIFGRNDWVGHIRTVVRQYFGDVAEEGLGTFHLADKAIGAKIASSGISFIPETMIMGNCGRRARTILVSSVPTITGII